MEVEVVSSPPTPAEPLWLVILKKLRYVASSLIIGFSAFIIFYGILANESAFTRTFPSSPAALSFIVFICLIIFFGLLEGAVVSHVDLSKHTNETFRQKYSRTAIAHKWISGPRIMNLSKFLMGRQVMVIFTQFFLSSLVAFPAMDNFPFTDTPFPPLFKQIFVSTGLLNVTFVTTFGSLVPELIATRYPVQFMNLFPIRFITYAGLTLEATGIAHFSWVLHHTIAHFFRMDSNVSKRVMGEVLNHTADSCSQDHLSDNIEVFPRLKNKKGKWKEQFELAQEWQKMGYKSPIGVSPDFPDLISKMLKIAEANPRVHLAATSIVYAN